MKLTFPHEAVARTRSESEARADIAISRASNVVRLESPADKAHAAFLSIVERASEMTTERMLFEARSVVHDLNERDYISGAEFDAKLIAECKRLTGDELKARMLASAVLG